MELMFENRWNGNSGMLDRLNSFRHDIEEAAGGHMHPRADVIEDKDAYHFYFDMPGLKGESLDVQVEDDQLTVAAERKRPEWPQETEVHIAERGHGPIRRAFKLPVNASRDGIRASYTDGVLELTVEKRIESKPVKIQVN
jgi:HSP20 family protein